MRGARLLFFPIVLLSLLAGSSGHATQVIPLDLAHLVAQSDRIELARVEGQTARWTADHSGIVTELSLRVERSIKGGLHEGDRVQVLREGGELGGVGMRVEGAARFAPNEDVLVFLEQRGGATWTVGMAQGKMHVETVAGRRVVTRDLRGLSFIGHLSPNDVPSGGGEMPLDDLLRSIHQWMNNPSTRKR